MLQKISLRQNLFRLDEKAARLDMVSPIVPSITRILSDQYATFSPSELLSVKFALLQLRRHREWSSPSFDLIWRVPGQEFTECLLCMPNDQAAPGGWLVGENPAVCLGETVNEFAVIITRFRNMSLRHTFDRAAGGFAPDFGRIPASLASALRLARQRSQMKSSAHQIED